MPRVLRRINKVSLTLHDVAMARRLGAWPGGSGAINQVMPIPSLKLLERAGLADRLAPDACGDRWVLNDAGRAFVAEFGGEVRP